MLLLTLLLLFHPPADAGEADEKRAFLAQLETLAEERSKDIQKQIAQPERAAFRSALKRGLAVLVDKAHAVKGPLIRNSLLISLLTPFTFMIDQAVIGALWATGNWKLALAYKAMPGTVTMNAVAVGISESLDMIRLSRELGIQDKPWRLAALMRERKRILGALNSNHILSVMYDAQSEAVPLRVVRKIRERMQEHPDLYVERSRLEAIVRKHPEGKNFLRASGSLINRSQLYVMTLLDFIQDSPDLRRELDTAIAVARAAKSAPSALDKVRAQLHEINDARSRITHLSATLGDEQERLKATAMANLKQKLLGASDEEHRALFGLASRMGARMDELFRELRRVEYGHLYQQVYKGELPQAKIWDTSGRLAEFGGEERKLRRMLDALARTPADEMPARLAGLLALERELYQIGPGLQSAALGKIASAHARFVGDCKKMYSALTSLAP